MSGPSTLQIGEVWQRTWTIGEQTTEEQRVIVSCDTDGTVVWTGWPFIADQFIVSSHSDWQVWQSQAQLTLPGLALAAEFSRTKPTSPGYYHTLCLSQRTFTVQKLAKADAAGKFWLYGPQVMPTAAQTGKRRRLN